MANSGRGQTWGHEEILALIRIWSDQAIQDRLDGATQTSDVYKRIAQALAEAGYERSWKQCKDKLKNLRQFYKDLKDGHSKSGHDRDTWPYFELIDSVVGDRPLNSPRALLDTLQQEAPLSPSNGTEQVSASINNSDDEEAAEATGSLDSSTETGQQHGSTPRSSTTPTEQLQDEAIATAGPEQHGPSEQQQKKKGKRTKVEAAIDSMTKAFAQSSREADEKWVKFEEKRMKFEAENERRREKKQREHEIRMFQMLGQMLMSTSSPMMYPPAAPPPPSHVPYFMPGPPPDPNQDGNEQH